MKSSPLLVLLCAFLLTALLVSCSPQDDALITDNTTVLEGDNIDEVAPDDSTVQKEVDKESITSTVAPAPVLADVPKGTEVALATKSLELSKPVFGQDQRHELKFFSSVIDQSESLSLCFVPLCSKTPQVFISVNGDAVDMPSITCDETVCVDMDVSSFENGPNTILFLSMASEDYEVDDVILSYELANGTKLSVPGGSFSIDASDEGEVESFKTVENVELRTVQTQTVKLSSQDALTDLVLSASFLQTTGKLTVIVNGHEVFSDVVSKNEEITLPKEVLKAGNNELVFIGSAK